MQASRRAALINHLRQFAKSTGLPLDYVRKSPRKNAPMIVRFLKGSEKGARRRWICAERQARAQRTCPGYHKPLFV